MLLLHFFKNPTQIPLPCLAPGGEGVEETLQITWTSFSLRSSERFIPTGQILEAPWKACHSPEREWGRKAQYQAASAPALRGWGRQTLVIPWLCGPFV